MRTTRLFHAAMLSALIGLAACSGEQATPLEPQAPNPALPSGIEAPELSASFNKDPKGKKLASCKPLPAASTSASIGLFGGTIKIGPHSLWIPPGALLSKKTISAKIVANDSTNSVQFSPDGLQFKAPGLLTLSYANCKKPSPLTFMHVVYTSNNLLSILELLPSIDNVFKKTTTGTLSHFSRYAVAF